MTRHLQALAQRQSKRRAALEASPVGQAAQRAKAMQMIERIRTDAGIFALIGDNAATTVQAAGRILYIALGAAIQSGHTGDEPELRVIRGAASAAGDITANPAALDAHRQAIQSGLDAVNRLWPTLEPRALIHAYITLEQKLTSAKGLNLSDFERIEA